MKNLVPTLIIYCLLIITNSRIIVNSPVSLIEYFNIKYPDSSIPYAIANYGDVPYGKMMMGQIDTSSVLQNCIYDQIDTASDKSGMFILSERAGCTFTQKSLNAQKQGAKLAIISDSVSQTSQKIIMVDDGRGELVHIPTILIRKQDGDKIVQTIQQNQTVIITIDFQTNKNENAAIVFFLQANDHQTYVFLRKFKWYFQRISNRINLELRFKTYPCQNCVQTNCFGNKSFCQNAFGHWNVENVGQAVIQQQLRQQILFKVEPQKWWKYVSKFDKQCIDWAVVEQCSQKMMQELEIDYTSINKQLKATFSSDKSSNLLLQQNQAKRKQMHAILSPSIFINNVAYRGNFQAKDVFEMICSSLSPMPQECDLEPKVSKGLTIWEWVIIGVCIFIVFLIFLLVCYRRHARKKASQNVTAQVNQLVNQYITMYETQKFAKPAHLNEAAY